MKSVLKIVEDKCWNCNKMVKLPFVDNTIGPKYYTDKLIKIAIQHGAVIENRHSNTRQESYNSNVCPHCNQMFGEHYLVNYWYSKTLETIEIESDLIITENGMLIY